MPALLHPLLRIALRTLSVASNELQYTGTNKYNSMQLDPSERTSPQYEIKTDVYESVGRDRNLYLSESEKLCN